MEMSGKQTVKQSQLQDSLVMAFVIGWSKYRLADNYRSNAFCGSHSALWDDVESGNSHHFSEVTDSPLYSPNSRQFRILPVIRAMQGDCERVQQTEDVIVLVQILMQGISRAPIQYKDDILPV